MAVAQDHGAPRADVIDIALAVGVPEISTLRALHKARGAADRLEGAYGGVHAAGNDSAGTFKELLVQVGGHG